MRQKVLSVALVFVFALTLTATAQEKLIYEEHFDSETVLDAWTFPVGDWFIDDSSMVNVDMENIATNAYTPLLQDADRLVYEWQVTFTKGTDGAIWTPAAGIHIMANDPARMSRGSSYLIWQEQYHFKIYRGEGDEIKTLHTAGSWDAHSKAGITPGSTHVFRVIYDRQLGSITVYRDGEALATVIDGDPVQTGHYISLRTNQTTAAFDYIKVWASE